MGVFWRNLCLLTFLLTPFPAASHYSNVTLKSTSGDVEVVVYLPAGVKPTETTYYVSSRFEHGSMIGSIKTRSRRVGGDGKVLERVHELFGDTNWRLPHNSQWPESGIGLASEFGVGDDGAFCQYRCGWGALEGVTNGVLGYREARNGEPFLKIGVGALIKGSCPSCDSTDNYRFNSPYEFAELPQWHVVQSSKDILAIQHEAVVKQYGYRLHKDIVLDNNVLLVTSVLTNLGTEAFSTAWYSHNFYTCDGVPIREGYEVDLDVSGHKQGTPLYEEPGVIGSWAEPLQNFASVKEYKDHVTIDVTRPLEDDTRIKAEFVKDSASKGGFTLHGCSIQLTSDLPDVQRGDLPMYAYNLYLEKGTFSPEPQIMIHLEPGASTSWTQRLTVETNEEQETTSLLRSLVSLKSFKLGCVPSGSVWKLLPAVVVVVFAVSTLAFSRLSYRRSHYRPIPDVS